MIVLVRHGETDANRSGLLLGRADPPLNARGRQQAAAVAQAFGSEIPSAVLTSPLARALETAEAIAAATGAPVTVDDRLTELDYGDWDQRRVADIPAELAAQWRADVHFAPPGGESLADLRDRVAPLGVELQADASATVPIIVSHVSPIKALILWALDLGDEYAWRLRLDVASISRVTLGPGPAVLNTFNETGHLR